VSLLLVVPGAEKTFRDFNMKLPRATQLTLAVARWVGDYWYVLPFWFALFLAADGGLLVLLYRRRRSLAWAWALLNAAIPLVLNLLAFLTIQLSMEKLLDTLGG
jgi:type II secretory pathway component PulF